MHLKDACKKVLKKKEIVSEKNIQKYLYINSPNPDILIRTGDTHRLSNFLLWQIAYTELYFLDKLWPDFNEKVIIKIINNYKKIKRNYRIRKVSLKLKKRLIISFFLFLFLDLMLLLVDEKTTYPNFYYFFL